MNNTNQTNTFLKILSWNCNGLKNKLHELRDYLEQHEIDIILLQETFLNTQTNPKICNYTLYNTPRENSTKPRSHGGTAIYVSDLISHDLTTNNNINTENTAIKIYFDKKEIEIYSMYIPPTKRIADFPYAEIKNLLPQTRF